MENIPRKVTDEARKKPVSKKELYIGNSASQSMWLVKVPQALFDSWTNKDGNEVIGKLSIVRSNTTGDTPTDTKIIIKLPIEDENEVDIPTEYLANELPGGVDMIPFVHNEESGGFSVKGKITKHLTVRPKGDARYRELVRQRTANALKRTRVVKAVDGNDAFDAQMKSNQSSIIDFIPPVSADARRRQTDQKSGALKKIKTSGEGNDLRSKMFQAFETSEYLTLKDICIFCQSSEKDVKETLKEYANFHAKGKFRNFWELKPEYRVIQNSSSKSTSQDL